MTAGHHLFPDFEAFWASIVDDVAKELYSFGYHTPMLPEWPNVSPRTRAIITEKAEKLLDRLKANYWLLSMSQESLSTEVIKKRKLAHSRLKRLQEAKAMVIGWKHTSYEPRQASFAALLKVLK